MARSAIDAGAGLNPKPDSIIRGRLSFEIRILASKRIMSNFVSLTRAGPGLGARSHQPGDDPFGRATGDGFRRPLGVLRFRLRQGIDRQRRRRTGKAAATKEKRGSTVRVYSLSGITEASIIQAFLPDGRQWTESLTVARGAAGAVAKRRRGPVELDRSGGSSGQCLRLLLGGLSRSSRSRARQWNDRIDPASRARDSRDGWRIERLTELSAACGEPRVSMLISSSSAAAT